jgi:HPt (histidine-containing phosphotransfer) domain-containing protein
LNLKKLLERVEDDQEFACELLRIFREDCQSIMEKARIAMGQRDLPGLIRAAHTMKGMLRNLSMSGAGEIAFSLETVAREGNDRGAEESLARLAQAIAELLPEVDAQLAGVKA